MSFFESHFSCESFWENVSSVNNNTNNIYIRERERETEADFNKSIVVIRKTSQRETSTSDFFQLPISPLIFRFFQTFFSASKKTIYQWRKKNTLRDNLHVLVWVFDETTASFIQWGVIIIILRKSFHLHLIPLPSFTAAFLRYWWNWAIIVESRAAGPRNLNAEEGGGAGEHENNVTPAPQSTTSSRHQSCLTSGASVKRKAMEKKGWAIDI